MCVRIPTCCKVQGYQSYGHLIVPPSPMLYLDCLLYPRLHLCSQKDTTIILITQLPCVKDPTKKSSDGSFPKPVNVVSLQTCSPLRLHSQT